MIELRWNNRKITILDELMEEVDSRIEKTLQYRERLNPLEVGLQEPICSEWKDVPEVTP